MNTSRASTPAAPPDVEDNSLDLSDCKNSEGESASGEQCKTGANGTSKKRRRVWIGRGAVALVVLGVALPTYILLNTSEKNSFETAFDQFARTVRGAALGRQKDLKDAIAALEAAISVHGETTTTTSWPLVTIPMFESFAHDYKAISLAEFVGINNVVHHRDRQAMVNFTTQHYESWVQSGHLLAYGNLEKLNQDPTKYQRFVSMKTENGTWIEDKVRDVYYVRTVQSPPNRAYGPLVNWNMASTFNLKITEATMLLGNQTLFSEVRPFKAMSKEEHQGFHTNDDADHPHTFVFHPVHRKVKDPTSEVVAVINSAIAWDAPMVGLLPESVRGIVCVIRNSCQQAYTYEINGKDALYVGAGDHHDPHYDYLERSVDLSSIYHAHPGLKTTPNHCLYSMSIYPTEEFENSYNSNTPELYAGLVAATFLLVALLFLVYEAIVERRNKRLETRAARSDAVIESLFPNEFRAKVLDHHDSHSCPSLGSGIEGISSPNASSSGPLAELYPETTILFMDLAGFTSWSNSREPKQVFELLETFYEAFDAIAKRRRVYKIETVGDCYVAVTGLPKPQENHAVIMVKFANECLERMHDLTMQLVDTLGEDTLELDLRVGLHSGQVTGGVLRGNKSRFQLFGDTMNTAARMESNGVPGRIHASKATADRLIAKSKGDWVCPREDKITAKGLGELQTYWITPESACTASIGTSTSFQAIAPETYPIPLIGADPS